MRERGRKAKSKNERGNKMSKLNDLIVIGIWMMVYASVILGGHIEGNLKMGGFLYQMGIELPRFIYWVIAIINVIVVWYIFHVIGVIGTKGGPLCGIFFGGMMLYALVSTVEPNCVIALTAFYGFCLTCIGVLHGPFK